MSAGSVAGTRGELSISAVSLVEKLPLSLVGGQTLGIVSPALGGEISEAQGGEGGEGGVLQGEGQLGPVVPVGLHQVERVGVVVQHGVRSSLPGTVRQVDSVAGVQPV